MSRLFHLATYEAMDQSCLADWALFTKHDNEMVEKALFILDEGLDLETVLGQTAYKLRF